MKSRIFFGLLVFFVLFLICFLPSFAYYNFLSPEANSYLENLKEKFREKEIVLEKEEGVVWIVELPKNDGVEMEEVQEAVYNDETKKFEAIYTFTYITILNAQGPTKVVWGSASKFHPYDVPRLRFIIEDFNWFEPGIIPAIGNGYYYDDIYIPTDMTSPETNPGDNYTYYQITLPPDPANIPPGTTFPSIGFYVPDNL